MRKLLIPLLFLLPVSLLSPGCGGSASSKTKTSGITYRALISNSVGSGAGVYIVNAATDVLPRLAAIPAGATPGMMVVTPNRTQTLVFSGDNRPSSDNQFSIIDNTSETTVGHTTLPGYTESFVVSPDSSAAYIAMPTASVIGQSQGLIEVISLNTGAFTGEIDIPSVHYLSISNSGSRVLAFSDVLASLAPPCDQTPSFLFVVTPSNVGIQPCPMVPVSGIKHPFDHPITAFFSSDDTAAYVVNCGAECGGVQASVQKLEMVPAQCLPDGVCAAAPVPAATVALVENSSTMYLAGTPYSGGVPSQACNGQTTAAPTCGVLTIFDLNTMSIVQPAVPPSYCAAGQQCPIVITDGYHNRIALGGNGQLFVGARTCSEIIPPQPPPQGAEVRGCLSIYNTLATAVGNVPAGSVVVPPANGDATGIQSIAKRTVVYVIQGGSLSIYDDTIDALEYNPNDPKNPGQIFGLVGYFIDVKTIDF